jgi:hypothetical protein
MATKATVSADDISGEDFTRFLEQYESCMESISESKGSKSIEGFPFDSRP